MNSNLNVLVVDDSFSMRKILKGILKQVGIKNIQDADNGKNALKVLEKYKPNIIFLDWNMPIMDGSEFLTKIKTNENLKDIPVLMVTSNADKRSVIEAINAGAADYITKPFTEKTIQEKLERHIKLGLN